MQVEVSADELGAQDVGIRGAKVGVAMRYVAGEGVVLGVIGEGAVDHAPTQGFADGMLELATDAEVGALITSQLGSSTALTIGRLSRADIDAQLKAAGFARHTFMCGQSGAGKTYSMGVLLERLLLETSLPLVIVDPNSDFVGLGRLRSRDDLNRYRQKPLSRAAHATLKVLYEAQAHVAVARVSGGDVTLRIHLSDLSLDEQALTLGLDPVRDADEYAAFVDATNQVANTRYSVSEVEAALRIASTRPADDSPSALPTWASCTGRCGHAPTRHRSPSTVSGIEHSSSTPVL